MKIPISTATYWMLIVFGVEFAMGQKALDAFNAAFMVSSNYSEELCAIAFARTGDKQFKNPNEDSSRRYSWDPKPSVALKALGLTFGRENMVQYVPAKSMFYANGNSEWLRMLEEIHRKNGIHFKKAD